MKNVFTDAENKMFRTYIRLCESLWITEKSEEYWEHVRDSVEKFAAEYGAFGVSLSVALLDELKRRDEQK